MNIKKEHSIIIPLILVIFFTVLVYIMISPGIKLHSQDSTVTYNTGYESNTVSAKVINLIEEGQTDLGGTLQNYQVFDVELVEGDFKGSVLTVDYGLRQILGSDEKIKEELGIIEKDTSPFREGWITGTATAIGAFIPVFPFLIFSGSTAMWISFVISMAAHFGVGAARSFFTGRGIFRSGFDMFVVGFGVAAAGYLIGEFIMKLF